MKLSFTEMGTSRRGAGLGRVQSSFCHVQFERSIKFLSRDVEKAVVYIYSSGEKSGLEI